MPNIISKIGHNKDTSVHRKRRLLEKGLQYLGSKPIFSLIEINLLGRCNRSCSFCPVSKPDFYDKIDKNAKFLLSDYMKLLQELVEIKYRGLIVYSGLSEPLLFNEIDTFISETKKALPLARVEIITNGDTISIKLMKSLFDSGLDTLQISLYDGPEQFTKFAEMGSEIGLSSDQLLLRRRYYNNIDYGLNISSRGGIIDSSQYRDKHENEAIQLPLKKVCYYPFYMVKINYNGTATMCSHDWDERLILGNIKSQTILEIWNSEAGGIAKQSLSENNRAFSPCDKCDVSGDTMGRTHYMAWIKNKG